MDTNWLHDFLAWDFRPSHFSAADVKVGVAAAIDAGIGAIVVSPHHVSTAARALDTYIEHNSTMQRQGSDNAGREDNGKDAQGRDIADGDDADGDESASDDSAVLTIIAAVGFPSGRHHVLVKASEARLAISQGAHRVWASIDPSGFEPNAVLSELITLREAAPSPAQLGVIVPGDVAAGGSAGDNTTAGSAVPESIRELPENMRELAKICAFAKVERLVAAPQHASVLLEHMPIVLDSAVGGFHFDAEQPAEPGQEAQDSQQTGEQADAASLTEWLVAESADLAANKKALDKAKTAKNILAVIPVADGLVRSWRAARQ